VAHIDNEDEDEEINNELIRRRDRYREQLYEMGGNTGEFPPVEPPSLSPEDVYCLVDIYYDDKPILSAAT